ncbi:MAG: hypothetical protein CM1200mP2_37360 [Planctomycetaceae bacterium]|nr:MAG: hypothetical protein CM1200mP2_37360 [Planctomycetaceae bacterium]
MTQYRNQITIFVCAPLTAGVFTAVGPVSHQKQATAAGTATDQGLFPKSFGVLANEKLMFPVDMSDWPLRIDSSHQLFVDDYLLASVKNIKRTVHQATKFDGNPICPKHVPAEGGGPFSPIVIRDEPTGKFRMWYAGRVTFNLPSGTSFLFPALYANRTMGLPGTGPSWGSTSSRQQGQQHHHPRGNLWGVHIDHKEQDPRRRTRVLSGMNRSTSPAKATSFISPDGIHWTRETEEPLP